MSRGGQSDNDPVTLRRIAAECGMSLSGVSKILRNAYKANTPKGRKRVEEVTALARALGYIANGPARRLRSGRHRAITVLAPVDDKGHPEFLTYEYITGIANALAERSYGLTLLTYPNLQPQIAATKLRNRDMDGLLVLELSSPDLETFLAKASVPAMYVNVEPKPGLPTVSRDEYASARSVMQVAIGLGYRRFIIAGGGWDAASHFSHLRRMEGIADAAATNPEVVCVHPRIPSWYANFEKSIIASEPDADTLVLAIDANTALRLPNCLAPNQPMACCDDTHLFINVAPRLTRARFDRAEMGRIAAVHLIRHIENPSIPLEATLIEAQVQVSESTPLRPSMVKS